MRTKTPAGLFALMILFTASWTSRAQVDESVKGELRAAMRTSFARTKTTPFRTVETSERGQSPTTDDWKPDNSRVILSVYPNRTHTILKPPILESEAFTEVIWIAGIVYVKDAGGKWKQKDLERESVSNPASGNRFRDFYFPAEVSKCTPENGQCFRLVGWPVPRSKQDEKSLVRWTFWFDEAGVLYKYESIVFNHVDWSRTTLLYEYDSTIAVEAPR